MSDFFAEILLREGIGLQGRLSGTPTEQRRHAKEVGCQFDAPRPVGPQATDEGQNGVNSHSGRYSEDTHES